MVGRAWGRVPYRFNTTSDRPRALGLTNSFDFTLLYEGEVYLPAGSIDFEVNADDNGIVEIALDGTFGEPMRDEFDNASTHYPLEVPASGWYPIRAAVDQGSGAAFLELSFTPEARDRTPIDNTNTRVRITQASGLALTAFDGQPMFVELGTTGVRDSDVDFGSGTPSLDMEGLSFDDFAIRLAGQVRIDEPGEYVLSARASTAAEQAYLIHARLQHRLGPTHLDALVGERKAPCRAILITNGEVSTALNETARAADIEILQLRPVRS